MHKPMLFDGAFGTYYAQLMGAGEAPELANLDRKNTVYEIHCAYLEAGAQALKSNTFGANRGLCPGEDTLLRVLESGYALARRASQGAAPVFADIGPISDDDAAAQYAALAEAFLSFGADRFLFETQDAFAPLLPAIARIREKRPGALVYVSFAVSFDGYTRSGEFYKTLLRDAAGAGVDAAGLNCVCGPTHMRNLIAGLEPMGCPLIAMPNSSYPTLKNGRTVYLDNPAYFSDLLLELYRQGASVLGGCCGTTPAHIRAAAEKLRVARPVAAARRPARARPSAVPPATGPSRGKKLVAAELGAPVDTDLSFALGACERLKACGADFVTVPDSPLAKTRANSVMTAARLQRETGLPAVPHLSCRDRNRIAIKGELLSGSIEGLRGVLALTGDPIPEAERMTDRQVFGLNSYRLISFLKTLNEEVFSAAPYWICAALNLNAARFEAELDRAKRKAELGAQCFLTQPVFSERGVEALARAREALAGCRLLGGVMPVASYKNALFLNNEVAGIEIPQAVLARMKDKDREEVRTVSIGYCTEMIDRMKDFCDGYYLITPLQKIELTEALCRHIRKREAKEDTTCC